MKKRTLMILLVLLCIAEAATVCASAYRKMSDEV